MFAQHGHFEIELFDDGQIVLVRYEDAWNKEAIHSFFAALKKQPLAKRWVGVADLREWGGATPDLVPEYLPVIDWCIANGESATAIVVSNDLQFQFVSALAEHRGKHLQQAKFDNVEEALNWAREQLVLIGK